MIEINVKVCDDIRFVLIMHAIQMYFLSDRSSEVTTKQCDDLVQIINTS